MNRDDIIRMAREAGFDCAPDGHIYNKGTADSIPLDYALERFARSIEANVREEFTRRLNATVELAEAAEREACAKVCEDTYTGEEACGDWPTPEMCARAIRARGQQ
jgi:hypothetical protein